MSFFIHKHFDVHFLNNKDFLLHSNNIFINWRKRNINTKLLSNPVVPKLCTGCPTAPVNSWRVSVWYFIHTFWTFKASKTTHLRLCTALTIDGAIFLGNVIYLGSWVFLVFVIKRTVKKSMGTENEGGLTQTDSRIWEVVQYTVAA